MKKMRWLWMLFALSVTAVAQEAPAALDPTLAEARALIDGGDPRAAIRKLEALNRSADPRVALMLGVASYHANDHARAIEHLSPVIDQLPADSLAQREAIQVLGLAHYLAGHLAAAIPLLERTRAFSPHNAELAYVLGMACVQTRRIECARESFARMFRVEAKSAAAHLVTAQMMLRVEFEEDAVAELKESLVKDPRLSGPNYLLGQIAIHRARYDEAIALLGRELEINPANAMAYYRLGDAYTRQLKWEEAAEPLQKSIWLNPYFSGPYILLGKTYLKRRQLPTAEGMLRRAIQFDPNNKSAHYLLGQVYQQMRRAEDARREFAIAEKLQGDRENPER